MYLLSNLPNIGKTLELKLINAGIKTPQDLFDLGAEPAFLLIETAENNTKCFNMLCALEGAIQGVRWHSLSIERKDELRNFLQIKRI